MLQQIEDFIYKIPIIILFAVPVLLVLIVAVGPIFRRVRYNWTSLILLVAALAAAFYVIVIRFSGLQ